MSRTDAALLLAAAALRPPPTLGAPRAHERVDAEVHHIGVVLRPPHVAGPPGATADARFATSLRRLLPLAALADEVARSLPAGTLSLAGTQPTCTVVREDVEFDCTLARAPRPEVSDWKGTVEPTVDDTRHVNGGCRSLQSDGRHWRCYLGQEAVREKIIGAGFLGEYAPSPGVG